MDINNDNVGRIMQEYANKAYNYEEAFKILNRTQDDVNDLRNIVKHFHVVPKSITDHHVINKFSKMLKFTFQIYENFSSYVFCLMDII